MRQIILLVLLIGALAGCASHKTGREPMPAEFHAVVFVEGHEVHSPGAYPWRSGMTVKDVIKAADGLSEFADRARIRVTHTDGTHENYKHAMIVSGQTKDPLLRPGDRVYVTTPYL